MRAAFLPGGSRVTVSDVPDPAPGPGQVVLAMRASTICGSDVRAIYREHLGTGPEAYQDVVAGHEPCGEIMAVGTGVRRVRVGDRATVYHISGCGQCSECRRGYQISCTSPLRAAYGWQRDGGHAEFMLAEERDLVPIPDSLSFIDGSVVACGGITAYEALCRVDVSGRDVVLVVGLGPVGQLVGLLAKAMGASRVVGTDPSASRRAAALSLGAVDEAVPAEALADLLPTGAEVAIDCSGAGPGQLTTLRHAARWGRVALVGEGGRLEVDVSEMIIHKQLTIHGSWVSSTWRAAELVDRLDRWSLSLGSVVTDTFSLAETGRGYEIADAGRSGKVAILPNG